MTALDRSLTLRPELLPINSAVARGIVDSHDFYALASLLTGNARAADRLRLGAAIPHGDGQINDMLHLLQRLDATRSIHDQDPDALDDLADEFADLAAQIVSGLHYRAEYWRDPHARAERNSVD